MAKFKKNPPRERKREITFDGQVVLKEREDYPRTVKQRFDPSRETVTTFLTMLREGKPRSAIRFLRDMNVLTESGFKLPRSATEEER
jgi:hypothetical protein